MDVSIIIPTYNGGELLRRTLTAIYNQQTTKTYEVIIIDSCSGPDTTAIFADFPVQLHQIPKHTFNHGATRDQGASLSQGEFLIFINQDAEPGNDRWLDGMIAPFANPEVLAVQGGIREREDMERFFWDSCGERFYFTSESKNWIKRYHNMGFSTVNCAIRRSVWEKFPFGRMDIAEDKGFQRRVHKQGHEIVYSEAFVYHTHNYNFRQIWRRCQDEGYGWRLVDENYTLWQAVKDSFLWHNYKTLWQGIREGKVKQFSEVIYPFLRPTWVYIGNHFNRGLVK
jgi:rhamnosyltransferase